MLSLGLSITSAAIMSKGISPVALWLASSGALPAFLTTARAGGAMMFDSTGKLTWAPENLVPNSNDFSEATWSKSNSAVSGALVYPTAGGASIYNTIDTVDPTIISIEAKASGKNWVWIINNNGSAGSAWFNVSTGAVGTVVSGYTADIEPSSDGYYRIWVKRSTGGFTYAQIGISNSDNSLSTSVNGTDGILFRNAQAERVTYETTPRTYNPTTNAAYYGPRFDYDPATLAPLGLLLEGSRTNVVLWNRDLTNAAWDATNITPLKDQTGIDGVANSASKITATAGNGTILQAITLASSARFQSAYVKRITGSGVIEMTTDNGTTWTAITVTADWTKATIPTQTLADPTVGFRIVTSGDAIAVDFVQNENDGFATSPMWTTTAAVTRATDAVAAALYTTNPAQIEYEEVANPGVIQTDDLTQLSDISTYQNIWLRKVTVYL